MKKTVQLQLLFVCAACAAAFAVYYPGLSGGFALDDYTNIVENAAVHVTALSWTDLSRAMFSFRAGPTMRPVSMLSFALNSYFFGPDAEPFKAVNLGIHIINGLLVCIFLLQLLRAYRSQRAPAVAEHDVEWLALVAAALWLLHPLNLMPVLYVVQRETSLSGLFVLLGCNAYIWGRNRRLTGHSGHWAVWVLVPLCTLIATICKESGALLPVYTLVIEACIFRFRRADGGIERETLLFYLLTLVLPLCGALAWIIGSNGGPLDYRFRDFTLVERLLTETRVLWLYISLTFLPDLRTMGLYHDDIAVSHGLLQPPTTLIAIAGLLLLAVACLRWRRRYPLVVLGCAWFFGGQLMESSVFPLELAYEHRCYLPDLGLILAGTSLIYPFGLQGHFRLPRYAILAAAVCACGLLTWVRASDWSDNLTFAAAEARHHPQSPYATYMLGQTYANIALFDDASQYPQAVAALRAASAVPHSSVIPDVSLILVESQLKNLNDAAALQNIAYKLGRQRITASDIQGLNALVDCANKGNCRLPRDRMLSMFEAALANPEAGKMPGSLANVLVIYGNYLAAIDPHQLPKARQLMAQAADLIPHEAQFRANLVTMDIDMGDASLASQDLDALRKMNYLGHLDAQIADFESQIARLRAVPQR